MNINISKKTLAITVILLSLLTIIYTLIFSFVIKSEIDKIKKDVSNISLQYSDAKISFITDIQKESKYTLLEYDGKIGVYDSESLELVEILNVYVITLPDADKAMLKDGISANSVKELVSLIEDYTS